MFGQLALVSSSLFTGAAAVISIAEQPARLKTDDRELLKEFQTSYPNAAKMQAPLAMSGAIFGLLQCLIYGGSSWFFGAVLIFANWPFTFLAIMPVNNKLMAMPENSVNAEIRPLLEQWGQLHMVRTILGVASTVLFLLGSLY